MIFVCSKMLAKIIYKILHLDSVFMVGHIVADSVIKLQDE